MTNCFNYLIIYNYNSFPGVDFQVKFENVVSSIHSINSGVPQTSSLSAFLSSLSTEDLPTSATVTPATFADYTAILSTDTSKIGASEKLQLHLDKIHQWYQ